MEKLEKAVQSLFTELEKGKKMPIGTVSKGKKKVAEGKWVPVTDGKKEPAKDEKKPEKDKKKEPDKKEKKPMDEAKRGVIKDTLKKFANILAEALSGKDVNQPTGQAVEQTAENLQNSQKQKVKPEQKKPEPQKDKK